MRHYTYSILLFYQLSNYQRYSAWNSSWIWNSGHITKRERTKRTNQRDKRGARFNAGEQFYDWQ